MNLKNSLKSIAALLFIASFAAGQTARASSAPDWVFMDLGEVIVTGNPTDGYTYVPGVLDLITSLKQAGLKIALISNIPEAWGASCDLKFAGLQQFLASRLNEPTPFDWPLLDRVILPPFDRYRKPQPLMFINALAAACPGRAVFIGEDPDEIKAASTIGFATIDTSLLAGGLPDVSGITQKIENEFNFAHPAACSFLPLIDQALEPQDAGLVEGCVLQP